MKYFVCTLLIWIQISFISAQEQEVQFFGHRGARGIYPENTIEGFKKALTFPIDGVEWDVVMNKDKQLVISHEPYFSSTFCLDKEGKNIDNEKEHNIYLMSQPEIETFDCGTKHHPRFPQQEKVKEYKPLAQACFDSIDFSSKIILYEIKSEKKEYGKSQPHPADFAKQILAEVENFKYKQNIIFMSFDPAILEEIQKITNEYKIVYLTYLPFKSSKKFLNDLTFKPYALGMFYKTIRKSKVKNLKRRGVKTFAWTVNSKKEAQKLIRKGIHGIITDYPNEINQKMIMK
jgi:glycerophosphoryl diester phosphodiesterase